MATSNPNSNNGNPASWANGLLSELPPSKGRFFSPDGRYASFVYSRSDKELVVQSLKDLHLKITSSSGKWARQAAANEATTASEENEDHNTRLGDGDIAEDDVEMQRRKIKTNKIRFLGEVPPGMLGPKQRHNQKSLPPASSTGYYACLKVDCHANHKARIERASYIEKSGERCPYRFVKREFDELDAIILSFERGSHLHTCSTFNDHLLPLKKGEMSFILLGLIRHDSAKEFYEKDFGPLVKQRHESVRRRNRFDVLTLPDLERIARKFGLSTAPRQGAEDIEQVRQFLLARKAEGATVIYKPPGLPVGHPSVILDHAAWQHIKTEDCLFFAMSKLQRDVLTAVGTMIATDGTHAIFSYTNVKVIAVTVSSFKPGSQMRERGFPIALAITNSEREDIHRAIIITLRTAAPGWQPRVLMTDMAFSAYNAWSAEFPNLAWLWCVFHVWQAWIRRLRLLANPGGFSKSDWSELRGHLIRIVKELICPSRKDLTSSEWMDSCTQVSKVLWFTGLSEVAECWDSYVSRAERWAHPKRWDIIREVFGELDELPMLARSNNITESFFCVLNYRILDGKSVRTFTQFLSLWTAYEPRLLANLARANMLH